MFVFHKTNAFAENAGVLRLRKVTEDKAQYDERSNLYALKQMRKSSGFNEISMCEHLMVG